MSCKNGAIMNINTHFSLVNNENPSAGFNLDHGIKDYR